MKKHNHNKPNNRNFRRQFLFIFSILLSVTVVGLSGAFLGSILRRALLQQNASSPTMVDQQMTTTSISVATTQAFSSTPQPTPYTSAEVFSTPSTTSTATTVASSNPIETPTSLPGQTGVETYPVIEQPHMVPQDDWSGMTSTIPLTPQQPELITLHHEGVIFDGSMPAGEYLRAVQHWSIANQGWPDIPYHFVIDLEGIIYEGRPLDAQGDTNTSYDTRNMVHIAVLGKYDIGEQEPNELQINAIIELMAWIVATHHIPVDAEHIKGHRDYIPFDPVRGFHIDERTGEKITCPGDNLYVYLENGMILNGITERLARARNSMTTSTSTPNIPVYQIR